MIKEPRCPVSIDTILFRFYISILHSLQISRQDGIMQNPNEDTEWNDVLRAKGILPAKPKEAEVTEDDLIRMVEQTIKQKSGSELDILY